MEESRATAERKAKEQAERVAIATAKIEAQNAAKEKAAIAAKNKNAAAKQANAAQSATDADGWTGEQQKAMEAAMKSFPSSMATKERWIAIAETVEGKTAKDCFTRFKGIVAKLKAEQQAAK